MMTNATSPSSEVPASHLRAGQAAPRSRVATAYLAAVALLLRFGASLDDEARLLVVIDGTWAQAKRIYRQSPSLRALRPVAFDGAATSALEAMRSEPEAHCVSTVEACARALRLLEPTPAVSGAAAHLDASLRLMVDHQLRSVRERPAPRFKR